MAERNVSFANGVTIPLAIGSVLSLYGSTDQDTSLANLPTAPAVGARTVRIRGTVTVVGAPGGAVTVTVKQGQGTGGATVGQPTITSGTPAAGAAIPFEVVDSAPALPGLNYSVCLTTATSTGTANVVGEIEEVN